MIDKQKARTYIKAETEHPQPQPSIEVKKTNRKG